MSHVIFRLEDYEIDLIMQGKTCRIIRKTNILEKHENKWFKVQNRMYRVLNTMHIDDVYITYFAFMGIYGNVVE